MGSTVQSFNRDSQSSESPIADILVVDDRVENLRLLINILMKNGYEGRPAIDGLFALKSARIKQPDLILLDIKMPGMDGYEVCKQLKADHRTEKIPIIFISALHQPADKVKAFSAGCVDFISKPFQSEEVLARIKTHLALRHLNIRLESQNQKLKEESRLREEVEHMISHSIRGPLTAVKNLPALIEQNGNMNEKQLHLLDRIKEAGSRILKIVDNSLGLLRMERGEYVLIPQSIDIVKIIRDILDNEKIVIKNQAIGIDITINGTALGSDEGCRYVRGEEMLCYNVLYNLIHNAIEASTRGSRIKLDLLFEETVTIDIHNDQPVPDGIRQRFFDKYITAGKPNGTGLGTYVAKLAVETLGGHVNLKTSDESGTSVIVTLPKAPIQVTKN